MPAYLISAIRQPPYIVTPTRAVEGDDAPQALYKFIEDRRQEGVDLRGQSIIMRIPEGQ